MSIFKNRDRIKVKIFDYGDHFIASAGTKDITVCNCYGTTREAAKEMALFKLKQALEEIKPPTH
jgi:hypothetical protein